MKGITIVWLGMIVDMIITSFSSECYQDLSGQRVSVCVSRTQTDVVVANSRLVTGLGVSQEDNHNKSNGDLS